jgi:Zn-dependent protease with chaperone function
VVQVLRFGVLGWPRNYLLLGLPLLEGFAPGELRAVLAHEFAHLSKAHGRFGLDLPRTPFLGTIFQHLSRPRHPAVSCGRSSGGSSVVWPRFNACAFVLSRANEYEADAGRAPGRGRADGSALCRLALYDRVLDETFWPKVWEEASAPTPPEGVFLRLRGRSNAAWPRPEPPNAWKGVPSHHHQRGHAPLPDRALALWASFRPGRRAP